MIKASGIYAISNSVAGKIYIGSAVNLRSRLKAHVRSLQRGDHRNSRLQRAYRKYGLNTFEFKIILMCAVKDLLFYEQLSIDACRAVDTGYNIAPIAGSCLGIKATPERRAKISAAKTGKRLPLLSMALKGNKNALGAKRSLESIEKTVGPQRGVPRGPASPESKIRQAEAQCGKKHSVERRTRASDRMTGISHGPMSSEDRLIRSRALIGKPWSSARRAAHVEQNMESLTRRIAGQARRRERDRLLNA